MDDGLDLAELCWRTGGVAGLSAADLSLRELAWAARGRQEAEWARAAALMSWVGRVGPWVHPDKLNPYHREPPKTPEQEESESRQAFAMLGRALKDLTGRG